MLHKGCSHPNIISLFAAFKLRGCLFIVLEYAPNGNLYEAMRRKLSSDKILRIFFQVVSAVRFLHSKKIIHRDIKPENVLIDKQGNAKLCDFGFCAPFGDTQVRTTVCGTQGYLPPEIMTSPNQTEKVDIWCLGVLLFELLHGRFPFDTRGGMNFEAMVRGQRIIFRPDILPEVREIILSCLRFDPAQRPSADQLYNSPLNFFNVPPAPEPRSKTPEIARKTHPVPGPNVKIFGTQLPSKFTTPVKHTPMLTPMSAPAMAKSAIPRFTAPPINGSSQNINVTLSPFAEKPGKIMLQQSLPPLPTLNASAQASPELNLYDQRFMSKDNSDLLNFFNRDSPVKVPNRSVPGNSAPAALNESLINQNLNFNIYSNLNLPKLGAQHEARSPTPVRSAASTLPPIGQSQLVARNTPTQGVPAYGRISSLADIYVPPTNPRSVPKDPVRVSPADQNYNLLNMNFTTPPAFSPRLNLTNFPQFFSKAESLSAFESQRQHTPSTSGSVHTHVEDARLTTRPFPPEQPSGARIVKSFAQTRGPGLYPSLERAPGDNSTLNCDTSRNPEEYSIVSGKNSVGSDAENILMKRIEFRKGNASRSAASKNVLGTSINF